MPRTSNRPIEMWPKEGDESGKPLKTFPSATAAAEFLSTPERKCHRKNINRAAKGENLSVYGYRWKYVEAESIPDERWKPHPVFTHLHVSDMGRLKFMYGRVSRGGLQPNGYMRACIVHEQKQYHRYVHRLVMETFSLNPDPETRPDVNHINHIKDDNRLVNLEWCSREENNQAFVEFRKTKQWAYRTRHKKAMRKQGLE